MSWLYSKDILTDAEKKQKDVIFRSYYRYYNDGDRPRGMPKYLDKTQTERDLESKLEEFIKKILSKYLPKIDRQEFQMDSAISKLTTARDSARSFSAYSLVNYWIKTVKIEKDSAFIDGLTSELATQLKEITAKIVAIDPSMDGTGTEYARKEMKVKKTWTPELEELWKSMCKIMIEMGEFLQNIITGIEKAKALRLLSKEE